jgi:curved DNA-binding protein CbpA
MAEPLDAYKLLQVDPEAEDEVIQAAYRRLARKYHPDLASGPEAALKMASINAAWELVGEPAARAWYDRSRQAGTNMRVTPGDRPAPAPKPPRDQGRARQQPGATNPAPDTVSRDWTSGRSTHGGGFDPSMRSAEGLGAAGPPPGRPSGSVLTFGRYSGWSLGEIARRDLEYIEWLDRTPIGRTYRDQIDAILRTAGRRRSASTEATERRGLFRRR